jgi:ribonuclease HII
MSEDVSGGGMGSQQIVVGVDEAGRGCLAGSVFAGAVILSDRADISDLRDSKKITEAKREIIFDRVVTEHRYGVGYADVDEISKFNILQATFLAMKRAIDGLNLTLAEQSIVLVCVDGNQKIPSLKLRQQTFVKGDQLVKAISAASIVAKVSRDRDVRRLHTLYPQYGFDIHKGYGTETHRKSIAEFGPCPIHRKTFGGVKEYWSDNSSRASGARPTL